MDAGTWTSYPWLPAAFTSPTLVLTMAHASTTIGSSDATRATSGHGSSASGTTNTTGHDAGGHGSGGHGRLNPNMELIYWLEVFYLSCLGAFALAAAPWAIARFRHKAEWCAGWILR
ncbi:hypothetical protein PUNSTDRAFT_112033 [Punctularia strigosozonata HHB-11173 SS5]|uniref:uncharacterized protein n=1 Tax=Punctularia strigosozonata (strain HHB-11173) TaxID=741275 RepID=UPI0004418697|nr:uncharacterized protein PUNSTDRAFT_112033 [Punctularia strigosozonata HHB-11173 SS5]EIN12071.1 hypothetical protein PUNSTDRAFT_112033 [Punctularia strigosozonata HHB-11173 SS5]